MRGIRGAIPLRLSSQAELAAGEAIPVPTGKARRRSIDVTNFTPNLDFLGARENLHLVERWTRVDANTLE